LVTHPPDETLGGALDGRLPSIDVAAVTAGHHLGVDDPLHLSSPLPSLQAPPPPRCRWLPSRRRRPPPPTLSIPLVAALPPMKEMGGPIASGPYAGGPAPAIQAVSSKTPAPPTEEAGSRTDLWPPAFGGEGGTPHGSRHGPPSL
jgi:hypothetical protein